MTLLKRLLFVGLVGLALLGLSALLLFRAWHLDRGQTVLITFPPDANPPRTDLGLLLRKGDYNLQACCTHSTGVVDGLSGARGPARKFEVRSTDPLVHQGFRSELRLRPNYMREEFWYQGRVLVPADWLRSEMPVIAMQWRNTRDFYLGDPANMPPLALYIIGSDWHVVKRWDSRWISTLTPPRVEGDLTAATAPLEPGKWSEWTFHVRWSPQDDGFLKVWKDGNLLVDMQGPIGHQDLIGPYMKVGVYVPGWNDIGLEKNVATRILYFNLIAASGSPAKLPLPFNN